MQEPVLLTSSSEASFLHNRVENTGQGHIFIFCAFLSVKIGGLFESYWVFLFPSLLSHTPSEMNVSHYMVHLCTKSVIDHQRAFICLFST